MPSDTRLWWINHWMENAHARHREPLQPRHLELQAAHLRVSSWRGCGRWHRRHAHVPVPIPIPIAVPVPVPIAVPDQCAVGVPCTEYINRI